MDILYFGLKSNTIQSLMFFPLCPLGALRWLLCPSAVPHLCGWYVCDVGVRVCVP